MMVTTLSPGRPRQRLSPVSPIGKDSSLLINSGDHIMNGTSRSGSSGMKCCDRKDPPHFSYSISSSSSQPAMENYSPKRTPSLRHYCHRHVPNCNRKSAVLVIVFITLLGVAFIIFMGAATFFNYDTSDVLLQYHPSRSLTWNMGDNNDQQKIGTSNHFSDGDNPSPRIVWLMSFPNSGTSFILHMTREATNCTTATNYGLEGEIRDQPSIQAIQGPLGANGPWLELLRSKTTRIADTILTKTHCKGFCSGSFCGADRTFHTTRSFMTGCLTGNQGVLSNRGLRLTDKTYDKSLVKKAIHIFRHPLDNIVARFHLEYNEKSDAGNTKYVKAFPKNVTGFRRWCYLDDQNRGLVRSRFVDKRLRSYMLEIPCFNEFYRYTQWHNLAFETSRAMNLPTMVLHYHEFSDNFTKARDRTIAFLDLPLIGEGIGFDDGKVYSRYYTNHEKTAIRAFLLEFASAETWEQLQRYSFANSTTETLVTSASNQVASSQ